MSTGKGGLGPSMNVKGKLLLNELDLYRNYLN